MPPSPFSIGQTSHYTSVVADDHASESPNPEPTAEGEPIYAKVSKTVYADLRHLGKPGGTSQFDYSNVSKASGKADESNYAQIDWSAPPLPPPLVPERTGASARKPAANTAASSVPAFDPERGAEELTKACEQLDLAIRKLVQDFAKSKPKGFLNRSKDPASYGAGAARAELLKKLLSSDFSECATRAFRAKHAIDVTGERGKDQTPAMNFLKTKTAELTRNAFNALDDKQRKVLARHVGPSAEMKALAEEMTPKRETVAASTARDQVIEQLVNQVVAPARRTIT